MDTTLQSLTAQALRLSIEERAELAETLLGSIAPPEVLDPAWEAELAHRVAELDAGRVDLIPAEQVFAELRALIAAHPARADKA